MNYQQIRQWLHNLVFGEQGGNKPPKRTLSASALVMPDASRGWILDISHWNLPPVALKRMKDEYGLMGVIIKGCDGSLRARYSADHVATARAAGLPFGFYNWLYRAANVSIEAQTTAWVKQAQEFNPPLGMYIDAEWTTWGGAPSNPTASDLRAAHNAVKTKWGKSAATYTAPGYANQYLIGFDFSREELWNASYGGTVPLLPKTANTWLMWQFTGSLDGKALDPNGNYELDGSYFNGTKEQFAARFGGTIPTEPPVTSTLPSELMINGVKYIRS